MTAEAAASYDFAEVSRVLDIGGGLGQFTAAVLMANPHLHGAGFDVPEVAAAAANQLASTGLADRCVAIGGDFFEALPPDFDAHLVEVDSTTGMTLHAARSPTCVGQRCPTTAAFWARALGVGTPLAWASTPTSSATGTPAVGNA